MQLAPFVNMNAKRLRASRATAAITRTACSSTTSKGTLGPDEIETITNSFAGIAANLAAGAGLTSQHYPAGSRCTSGGSPCAW